jgi:origin recognition complex subunit 3
MDRIPFVLLFGIATSLELFHDRLPKIATRCLEGPQFDVEQTNLVLESVFRKAVASCRAPLHLGPSIVSSIVERQHDHVQSVQAFSASLKVGSSSSLSENKLTLSVCLYVSFLR